MHESNLLDIKYCNTQCNPSPILKWAGGKTQLLPQIMKNSPRSYGKYIEPFIGGGALFFSLSPKSAVIADSNPELINLYTVVAKEPKSLLDALCSFKNEEDFFYDVRSWDVNSLNDVTKAARTLYLNKTCYNGLYRVNKKGQFNVPFGHYKKPNFCNEQLIMAASEILGNTVIEHGDYMDVLKKHAEPGDFVFLDPPYLPVSKYSDFKRYTKEQFYEEDHIELANEVHRLHDMGCHVILTNSNHPLVMELYSQYSVEIVQTKRHINCNGQSRTGEDVIVTTPPKRNFSILANGIVLEKQIDKYPATRYMGSKQNMLKHIWGVASQFEFNTVADLFSGSGVVGYMFKSYGKQVISNDYMAMSATNARAMIGNNTVRLDDTDIAVLLSGGEPENLFVSETFKGLYFTDEENRFIDTVRSNIKKLRNAVKRDIAMAALMRACMKKRPRGIFTYTGHRYDDGRKDLKMSLAEQFVSAIHAINQAVFDNGQKNASYHGDTMALRCKPDLVYMDPPYYSPLSDNEYVRRYHFLEGLAKDWQDVEMQWHTKTKKFKSYPTPFSSRTGAYDAFDKLFRKYRDSIMIVSYSSNSLPTKSEIVGLMAKYKQCVEVVEVDYKYCIGTQGHKVGDNRNSVNEYLFVGY